MESAEANNSTISSVRYLWIFVLACICFAAFMVSINLFVDRYYVFHPQDGEFFEILEPNTRFLKASYLDSRCADFDAVMMGSSRDVGYLTEDINRVFGTTSYNYGVAAGDLRGILARLEWLASLNCLPGHIFLPLSMDKLRLPQRPDDLLRKEYPAIEGTLEYRREFVLSYLGTDALVSNIRKLIRHLRGKSEPKFRYDMATGDVWYLWNRTFEMESCTGDQFPVEQPVIHDFVEYLFAIESVATDNQSKIILLWNPQPLGSQLDHVRDAESLFAAISERFTHIYRLPFDDTRLIDSDYFHDEGHFSHELGAAVMSSPENRVSLNQLLSELREADRVCRVGLNDSN